MIFDITKEEILHIAAYVSKNIDIYVKTSHHTVRIKKCRMKIFYWDSEAKIWTFE